MGSVYKAADQVLRRFVAIKLLHTSVANNPKSVERFVREARSAASIGHPNIIDILDFGHEKKTPFLVMEYLRGSSLAHAIATDGPFAVERAARIATHTLAGLQAAHDRGILHRDLKPANLMLISYLGDREFVKICDFGFAALLQPKDHIAERDRGLTPARTLVGTPAYAAPERLRGDDRRDPRIDVYSVGVLLFEMLAGARPFEAPTFAELARKVRNDPPPSLRAYRKDIPPDLDRVIQKALAKKRDDRWFNAEALAAALVPFGGRWIPIDDAPSDSFSMDLLKITRRRSALLRATGSGERALENQSLIPEPGTIPQQPPLRTRDPLVARDDAPDGDPLRSTRVEFGHTPLVRPSSKPPPMPPRDIPRPTAAQLHSRSHPAPPPSLSGLAVPAPPPAPGRVRRPEPRHSMDAPAPPIDTDLPAAVHSSLVAPILESTSRRFGANALASLLAALPDNVRNYFPDGSHGVSAMPRWIAYEAVALLTEQVDARLGNDDLTLIAECGRAAAEGAFDLIRTIQPPDGPSAELLLAELPQVAKRLYVGIGLQVRRVGRGYGRMEVLEDVAPSLAGCVAIVGFIERALRHFGAKEVEVNMSSCRALGDDNTFLDITWLT